MKNEGGETPRIGERDEEEFELLSNRSFLGWADGSYNY